MDVVTFVLLSIIAPVLVQAIKFLTSKLGWEMNKQVVTIIVAVIATGAAFIIDAPNLPEYTDPMVFIQALLTIAGPVFATATVLYNLLLDKVFDMMGFVQRSHK
jgi:hypothetical protein